MDDIIKNFYLTFDDKRIPVEEAARDVTVAELISATTLKFDLPKHDSRNRNVNYRLKLKRTSSLLENSKELQQIPIVEGDELELLSDPAKNEEENSDKLNSVSSAGVNEVRFSAPILIPSQDQLAVDLVPANLVYQLEEYRSDQMRWEAVMWAFIGAILGIIVNWITNDPIQITRIS